MKTLLGVRSKESLRFHPLEAFDDSRFERARP